MDNKVKCNECGSNIRKIKLYIGGTIIEKRKILIIVFFVIIIITTLLFNYNYNISLFSKETLFWLFSTVLQAFAALIAFVATAIIFRLQNIRSEKNSIIERLRDLLRFFKNDEPLGYTHQDVINEAREIYSVEQKFWTDKSNQIKQLTERIDRLDKNSLGVKNSLQKSFIYNFIVMCLALIFLIFTEYIINYYLDISSVALILIFSFFSLFSVFRTLSVIR
jgi:hypothetical protein